MNNNPQIIIIAGGLGTRSKSKKPKILEKINGKELWKIQVESIQRSFSRPQINYFLGEHNFEVLNAISKDVNSLRCDVTFNIEDDRLGTGGALLQHIDSLQQECIVILGDLFFDFDFGAFMNYCKNKECFSVIVAHPNGHSIDSDTLLFDSFTNLISSIELKNKESNTSVIAVAGIYYFKNLPKFLSENFSLHEKYGFDIIDILIKSQKNNLRNYAYITSEYIKDAGTPERRNLIQLHEKNESVFKRAHRANSGCIFIDRDDTVTADLSKHKIYLAKGIGDAIALANNNGIKLFIVSNQPRAAKGWGIAKIDQENRNLDLELEKVGAYIDAWYWCPHHPDGGYLEEIRALKVLCKCRKPSPAMLNYIETDHSINIRKSIIIGDSEIDFQLAKNSGCQFFHTSEFIECEIIEDHTCFKLTQLAIREAIKILC